MLENQSLSNDQYEKPSHYTISYNTKSSREAITSMFHAVRKGTLLHIAHQSLNGQSANVILQSKPHHRPVLPGQRHRPQTGLPLLILHNLPANPALAQDLNPQILQSPALAPLQITAHSES